MTFKPYCAACGHWHFYPGIEGECAEAKALFENRQYRGVDYFCYVRAGRYKIVHDARTPMNAPVHGIMESKATAVEAWEAWERTKS